MIARGGMERFRGEKREGEMNLLRFLHSAFALRLRGYPGIYLSLAIVILDALAYLFCIDRGGMYRD
jgi:hypothetical protein